MEGDIMGLDIVELVMAVEETFGIQIDDNDALQIVGTPGNVAKYVAKRLSAARSGGCRSQARFYRLRGTLMRVWKTPRRKIRPATPLAELLPQDERLPERWARLSAALERPAMFPDLEYSPELARVLFAVRGAPLLLLMGIAALYAVGERSLLPALLSLLCLLLPVLVLTEGVAQRKKTRVPDGLRTITDLLPYVLTIPSDMSWTYERILETVLVLTSEQTGVPLHKIRADSRFIEDLGMD
jgi:acyl carrier protein